MKSRSVLLTLSFALCCGAAGSVAAQPAEPTTKVGAGTRDPVHIVSPTASPDRDKTPDAPELPYHLVQRPPLPNGISTSLVSAVGLTPEGHVIYFTRNPMAMLLEFDKNDKFLRTFDPNIAIGPHGLKVDRHGNIWLTDNFLNVVWKLNAKGEPIFTLGERGAVRPWDDNKWNGALNQPTDIAIDRDDNVFEVQGHGGTSNPLECTFCMTYAKAKSEPSQGSDPRIIKFDKNGMYVTSRSLAHEDGTWPTIHAVTVTPKGEVWVSDRQRQLIKVFDTNLNPIREMHEPRLVSGLFADAKGVVWMSAGMDGRIFKLADDGKVLGWLGEPGRSKEPTNPGIGEAHFLAVTPDENTIYLADSVNGKIMEWKHN